MKAIHKSLGIILFLIAIASASASQVPGHVYAALAAKEHLPKELKEIINSNLSAYLIGSSGPDIAYTAHYVQVGAGLFPAGTESHGDQPGKPPRSGDIVVEMLKTARNPEDHPYIAFAAGWLTHYCVDNVIHPLVNQHGGFYEEDAKLHKRLEMVECEHVFRQVDESLHDLYVLQPGPKSEKMPNVPAYLVNQAFADVFPSGGNSEHYQEKYIIRPDGTIHSRLDPPFVGIFRKSTENVRICSDAMRKAHQKQGYGLWASLEFLVALKGPPPSPEEYEKLMEPLKIGEVKLEITKDSGADGAEGYFVVEYTVNDLHLYKLFCDEWNEAAEYAINDCVQCLTAWWKNPSTFKVPNLNLNVGPKPFDAEKAWPGKPNTNRLLANVVVTDGKGGMVKILMPDKKTEWQFNSEWVSCPMAVPSEGDETYYEDLKTAIMWQALSGRHDVLSKVWGSSAGKAYVKIPFKAEGPGPYNVYVSLAFARPADRKPYDVGDYWNGKLGSGPEGEEPDREDVPDLTKVEPEPAEPAKPPPSGAAELKQTTMLGDFHRGGNLLGEAYMKVAANGQVTGGSWIADWRKDVVDRIGCNRIDAYADFKGKITEWNKDFKAEKQEAMKKEYWSVKVGKFEATGKWEAGKWLPPEGPDQKIPVARCKGTIQVKGTISEFQNGYSVSFSMNFAYDKDEWVSWGASSYTWDKDLKWHDSIQPVNGKSSAFPYWTDDANKVWNTD